MSNSSSAPGEMNATEIKRQALLDLAGHMCPACKRGTPVVKGAEYYNGNGHEWWHENMLMFRCKADAVHEAIERLCRDDEAQVPASNKGQ